MALSPYQKKIAKWTIPALAIISIIAVIALVVGGGPAGRKTKTKQKQL